MKAGMVTFGAALLCMAALAAAEDQVLSGQKIQQLQVAPDEWLDRSVVLEGTYDGIDRNFTKIERQNNYTQDMYVKFTLGQCPYPCLGMRASIEDALGGLARGDLVSARGDLVRIEQKRTLERVEGQYDAGRSWTERIQLVGPPPSEYFFSVGSVTKGWGKGDNPETMADEGWGLPETHYQKVDLEKVQEHLSAYREKAVRFEAPFYAIDDTFSEKEKQIGLTPDKFLQFRVEGSPLSLLIRKTPGVVEGFKEVARGAPVEVFGRIRAKSTPEGQWSGVIVDRAIATIRKKAGAPESAGSAASTTQSQAAEPAPPAGEAAAAAPPPPGGLP